MRTFRDLLIIFFLSLTYGCGHIVRENTPSDFINTSEHISNRQVNGFAEDNFGYIWIGTHRGLNRYNGYDFHQYYSTSDSLSMCDNQVLSVLKDSKGKMWVGTANGISCLTHEGRFVFVPFDGYQYASQIIETRKGDILANTRMCILKYDESVNRFVTAVTLPSEQPAIHISEDRTGRIWAVSYNGIQVFDADNMHAVKSLEPRWVFRHSYMQENGVLWLLDGNDIRMYDTRRDDFIETPAVITDDPKLKRSYVNAIYEGGNYGVFIYTSARELFLYNQASGELIHSTDNSFPFQVPDVEISCIFPDSRQNLWIGSTDQGFSVVYNYKKQFNNNARLSQFFEHKPVNALSAEGNNVWISTNRYGIYLLDASTQEIKKVEVEGCKPENKFSESFVDSDRNIWLVMDSYWLLCCRYDGRMLIPQKHYTLPASIFCLEEDHFGNLWAGCFGTHLFILRKGEEWFQPFELHSPGLTWSPRIVRLNNGKMAVVSLKWGLSIIDPQNMSVERIPMDEYLERSTFIPTSLYEDSTDNLWIGTIANGVLRYDTKKGGVTRAANTPCYDVSSITEDAQGNVWIGTLDGLCKYDRTTDKVFTYYEADGIGGNQFCEDAAIRTPNNMLIFGGTHGMTFFDPVDVLGRKNAPILFEDFLVDNVAQQAYRSNSLQRHMSMSPDITLDHRISNFSISYVALDFAEFPRVNYHYMLDGFDNGWIDARHNRQAFYSNIPSGKYRFRVRTINSGDMSIESEAFINVTVKSSFWAAPVMKWFVYPVIFILLAGFIVWQYWRYRRSRWEVEQALFEKEQEKRVNTMNMSFFTNISHEFRTPLTMISGPVEILVSDETVKGDRHTMLVMIQRNVQRMLKLVNQFMDFNKIENDTLRLKVRSTDIIGKLREINTTFAFGAREKGISVSQSGIEDSFVMLVDEDKLEKIMSNLFSNAIKFTPSGGNIAVSFDVIDSEGAADLFPAAKEDRAHNYIKIMVADSGPGIPEQHLEDIFKRYFQIETHDKEPSWGTGIGLYYSRKLAELHHGYLKAENRGDGGALFTLILPVDEVVYANDKHLSDKDKDTIIPDIQEHALATVSTEDASKPTVLVVEDDTEIAHFLKTMLSPHYNVVIRFNATSALDSVENISPDLIISDVVMPGMDGYTFCSEIKNSLAMRHIPVILLTAKSTVADQVEGLGAGADAYVVKPFAPSYLLALIKSQLSNRDKLRNILSHTTHADKIDEKILSPHDKEFMGSLYELMEKELSNTELNITLMTKTLNISRTKFYYKVKGLTGENPNVFFRTYKLNRAMELLDSGKYNISEVADITGFSTLSHFSVSFKKQFGKTPSESLHGKESGDKHDS